MQTTTSTSGAGILIAVTCIAVMSAAGCGDGGVDTFSETTTSAYVPVRQTSDGSTDGEFEGSRRFDIDLLDPEVLARREVEFQEGGRSTSSELAKQYSRQLSFRVRLTVGDDRFAIDAKQGNDLWEADDEQSPFRLETRDSVFYPLHILPEPCADLDEQVWIVVFDHPSLHHRQGDHPLTLIYDGKGVPTDSFRVEYSPASTSF